MFRPSRTSARHSVVFLSSAWPWNCRAAARWVRIRRACTMLWPSPVYIRIGLPGISIGGINAAIIAGNPPNMRVDRLREFWTQVTTDAPRQWFGWAAAKGDGARNLLNQFSANLALMQGAKGFFTARPLLPWFRNARGNQPLRHP